MPQPPAGGAAYRPGRLPRRREDVADTLARTLWGELCRPSLPALEALAWVVLNRAHLGRQRPDGRWPDTVARVCLQPGAFAAWEPATAGDVAAATVSEADPAFVLCRRVAWAALDGSLADPTGGATLFHREADPPRWAAQAVPAAVIAGLCLYRDRA